MTFDLFDTLDADAQESMRLSEGAVVLKGFLRGRADSLWREVQRLAAAAPFRHLETPGGYRMSVAMTNCGSRGWVSDRRGYRYDALDPLSGLAWPTMPSLLRQVAAEAASAAGFEGYAPDACLINRYEPGARLSLHQDRDERELRQPVVSLSLGLPATFLWGGLERGDKTVRVPLRHGDVVVWGGPSRLRYHGVSPVADGEHVLLGRQRVNLTFRVTA